jgi:outer membrane protein OmpA-like peptidoglycan-associated protein
MARITAVRESARGLIVSLPNILFETDQATLKPEGREALAKISGVLLIAEGYTLSVEGHTDEIGSAEYNLDLSEKRAAGVRDYLVAQGLARKNITVKGFGEAQPIASNQTAAGRQENRRVEIVVLETPDFGTRPTSQ